MHARAAAHSVFIAALLAMVFGVSNAPRAGGQVASGSVRDSATGRPISGAVLLALDSTGGLIVRTLTNERGEFRLQLSAGATRLQVLRIGFRPREVRLPERAIDAQTIEILMPPIPTLLEQVRVTDLASCPVRADRNAALALWEQARSALLASVVARETHPPSVLRLQFTRMPDGDAPEGIRQVVRIDSASAGRPFEASRPPTEFVRSGFMSESARGRTFYGPDADVLLDDSFAHGYCFRLANPSASRPHEVGLAFSPARNERARVDIDGTLWIDSVRRVITDIEYHYTNAGRRFGRSRPGGTVQFRDVGNGAAFIERWSIRPQDGNEMGGELARAAWPDGRVWRAPMGTLRLRTLTHAGAPAPGTRVRLLNTDYAAVSNDQGELEIVDLLPGPYAAVVMDAALDRVGIMLVTPLSFHARRDSVVRHTLDVPTAADYMRAVCEGERVPLGPTSLLGRVLFPDGAPADGAEWEVARWNGTEWRASDIHGETDARGMFHWCSVPSAGRIRVLIRHAGMVSVASELEAGAGVGVVAIRMERQL